MLFEDPAVAFASVIAVTAVGECITGAQTIANRRLFEPKGSLEWRLVRQYFGVSPGACSGSPTVSFDSDVAVSMGVLKCGSSVGAIIMVLVGLSPVIPLVGLVVSNAVLTIRAPFGATGADHMGNVLCFSALLAAIVPSPLATTACLGFIALQASLAYVTAGMGKIVHRGWRDGSVLREVLLSDAWGNERVARFIRGHERWPGAMARLVLAAELCFPILLFVPWEFAVAGLMVGVAFHVFIAIVLGLNTFLWIFPATYPAIMFTNMLIRESLPTW